MSEMINLEDLFASKVFTLGKMKERLPKYVYKEVINVMETAESFLLPQRMWLPKP